MVRFKGDITHTHRLAVSKTMVDGLNKTEPQCTTSTPMPSKGTLFTLQEKNITFHLHVYGDQKIRENGHFAFSLVSVYITQLKYSLTSRLPHSNPLCPTDPQHGRWPTDHRTVGNADIPFHQDIANSHPHFYNTDNYVLSW